MLAAVDTPRCTGFTDNNLAKLGQVGLEVTPDKLGKDLTGWVFQPLNLVEVVVIEDSVQGLPGFAQRGKILNPPGLLAHRALNMEGDAVRMPV